MKINKKLLMAALASAVIVSAPQAKTYADTQANDTQAVTEKLIDDQIAKAARPAEQSNSEKINAEGKQTQQESSELKSEKEKETKSDKSISKSQALSHPAQATALRSVDNGSDNSVLQLSDEKTPEAQGAGETAAVEDKNLQKADDPNYGEDEKKIKDYNGSERYKETDLQPGDTNQSLGKDDKKVEKDGLKFDLKNPSSTSTSKTEYGYQVTIDKETGQRTYTKIYVTDSGRAPVDKGDKPMMGQGDKLTPESPGVTYKPTENSTVDGAGTQRNLNYEASKETLEHINNKDNDSTSFGMKDNYTKEDPAVKFFGDSFLLGYKVNPWPNENDKLEELKLNKNNYDTKKKYFVQGQDIDTGIKVDNVDKSARERLVGQVYNPITGKIVPGASAYIADDGNIHIKLPEGALKKDEFGKTVINEDSIFNTPDYKALQNLDVKFFARPRTKDEFKNIAETPDDFGDTGTYVETGAGTADINHKGTNVTIDKQGIDRYDHYNLIGDFKLNLDDTRYYDQKFVDKDGKDTEKDTSIGVQPGESFTVKLDKPEGSGNTYKTVEEMNEAAGRGEAAGKLILDFINRENAGKEEKDKWKVDVNPKDIANFTITPPKSAKAGDFIAIPVEYTYTNGSKDTKWFHFVVQESDNNRPEYHAEIGFKGDTLTQTPELPNDEAATKKNQPTSYELVMPEDGSKYKDSAGNEWTDIKVDPNTGAVTAVVPEDADIKGGENLFVNVKVNYIDEKTKEEKSEIVKAQFIARPKYKEEVSKTFKSQIPFETKVIYDDTLEIGKVVKNEGRVGEIETSFKQVVINGEKGILDEKGNFVKDKEAVETKTITEKVDAEIRIGTKPAVTTVTIPSDTDYETSDSLKKGDMQLKEKGEEGEVTITTKRDPETGEITTTKVTTKEAKNKKMLIGTKTENTIVHEEKIPFEYEVTFDPSLKPGEKVVDQEGKPGSKTTTYKIENSQVVGDPTVKETAPTKAIIRVGDQKFTGETSHTVTEETKYITIIEEDPNLPVGETKEVQEGKRGSKTTKYTQKFENGVPGEVKEEVVSETPAVNRIVKVGTKTVTEHISKEITEEIPYKVEIKYDDTMIAGTTRVETPGQAGSKTTEYYRNLINGKFDGDLNSREVTDKYKAPVDEVIVVGTKVETNQEEYKNDVNVEIEKVEDPNLYKGIVNVGELIPGRVERKIVNKYDPKTGKVTTEETFEVTPAKQKITVGTKDFTGEFSHKIEKTLPYETEIQYDDTMEAGIKEVTQKGVNGNTEQTVTQKYTNGVLADKEYSKEETTKEPVKEIVKIGTKPVKKTVEIPFNTEYVYDENLEAGKTEEVTPGKNGKVTITTTYDKDQKKVVTSETEEKGRNRVVKIGRKPSEGETKKTIEREIPYETKVIYDEDLEAGTQKIEKEGKPGKEEVTITQKIKDSKPDGEATETTKTITEKEDRVVRIGVKPVVKETEVGNNTEYRHNPDLKEGETKVIEEGSKGSVKYTTTFNKETGKLEVTEERVEPTDKVVEYGSKTDGEFKFESEKAYDIIIRENPNLEAGKTNVIQEGKPGKTETTVKIENSKEVSRDTKTITEKQDKIIEIGTKNVCEIPPVKPEDPTKPGEKDPEDPTKPEDKDPENPTKPGTPGEKPNEPGTPGEKPNEPGTPGEKPNEPGTPGETPEENGKKPEENGKTPENNGKTPENNGKTPENNGKTPENNGKTPENNGKTPNKPNETPKTPETTEQGKRKEKADTPNRKSANKLPKAGSESEIMMLSMSALTTAAGFIGLKKKRKDR